MPDRPTTDEILDAVKLTGSIRKAGPHLGYDERSLRRWLAEDNPQQEGQEKTKLASQAAELRQVRKENREMSEALGKREEWLRQVVEAARIPVERPEFIVAPANHNALPERAVILPIFDIQYGQHVQAQDTPFSKGGFSDEVFQERLDAYVAKVTAFLRDKAASCQFTELHIPLGGDLVEGDQIYPGMAWQLEKDPIRQVLDLRTRLSEGLRQIIRFAREDLGVQAVAIYCVPGNHGKVGGKRAGATPSTYSWDYMAAELILDDLREEQVDLKVNEPSGAVLFTVLGHTFLTIHGDEIKGWGGLPFYGLAKADGQFIRLGEVIHDYLLMGHHHQPGNIPNGSGGANIVSGDWVGPNNLSRIIKAGSRPQQRALIVSAKHGLVEEAHIYLDGDRRERVKATVHNARAAA